MTEIALQDATNILKLLVISNHDLVTSLKPSDVIGDVRIVKRSVKSR